MRRFFYDLNGNFILRLSQMEVNPPIPNRSTQELLKIVEVPEHWQEEVVISAQKELIKRGVSSDLQDLRRTNYSRLQRKLKTIKARSSYTMVEKILIVLIGPVLMIFLSDLFLFHAGEGYRKKNIQGCLFSLLGLLLWLIILSLVFS